jgi:hypothetical protein
MLWNIFGWLGTGLIVNHVHTQNEGDFCEVSFCSCEVEDGNAFCSCHHPELHHKKGDEGNKADFHHADSDHGNEFCFYSSPHPVNDNPGEALLTFAKFNALLESQETAPSPVDKEFYIDTQTQFIPSGYSAQLLRPPRA